MTYTELSQINTTGFVTNNVIRDTISTARWAYTKAAFKKAEVTEYELNKIREWAAKEGCSFPTVVAA